MAQKRVIEWFVEPQDNHTDRVLYEAMARADLEAGAVEGLCTADGWRPNLYKVPSHAWITRFLRERD